jgi:Rieske Fe-S protein
MDSTRRDFLASAATVTACLTCGGSALVPEASAQDKPKPQAPTFDAGEIKSLKPGITDTFIKERLIAIVRKEDQVYATSAICTHKACTLRAQGGTELRCGCHGSRFDLEGNATKGPATDALPRYGVTAKDGRLIVDTRKIILPGDFEKEGAFVKVK